MTSNQFSSQRLKPDEIRKKIAELPVSYSDTEKLISISALILNAKSALQLVYVSLFFEYWETDNLIRAIAQKAYQQDYRGEWRTVQEFLETELQTPEQFEEKYIELKGPHDFFGNFLSKALVTSRQIKVLDKQKVSRKKVRYPEFRRGYRDKGSLRLISDFHGDRPVREKEDRRSELKHPLLVGYFLSVEG